MTGDPAGEIAQRLARVRVRIEQAALAAGRDPADVKLVAVSKLQPASAVRAAYGAGQRAFGENYVQELCAKRLELADLDAIEWHAIGHVQTNKARTLVGAASVIHSVDSTRLAIELGRRASEAGRVTSVLVQVNVAREAHKAGCAVGELPEVLGAIRAVSALRLLGLMTVPPQSDEPAAARVHFDALRALRDVHGGAALLPELSMGMTLDLEVAIAAGATMVRVGSAIFGARPTE